MLFTLEHNTHLRPPALNIHPSDDDLRSIIPADQRGPDGEKSTQSSGLQLSSIIPHCRLRGNWWDRATLSRSISSSGASSLERGDQSSSVPLYSLFLQKEFVSCPPYASPLPTSSAPFPWRMMQFPARANVACRGCIAVCTSFYSKCHMADVLLPVCTSHPGLITLHNYPNGTATPHEA